MGHPQAQQDRADACLALSGEREGQQARIVAAELLLGGQGHGRRRCFREVDESRPRRIHRSCPRGMVREDDVGEKQPHEPHEH